MKRWSILGAALAAPALFLFRRVLFAGETFIERDMQSFYRASRMTFVRLWADVPGIPMWNPWFASGQPFAANPEFQYFHPLTWLFVVFPFEWAFRLQVVIPVLLSGAAMAFLLVTLRRSAAAASLGALSWAYGGYLLSVSNLMPNLFGIVAVPLFLAFLVRVVREPSAAEAAGIGLCLGWMLLAGEVMVLAVGLAAPVAILHGLLGRGALGSGPRPRLAPWRCAAALAGALVLGLAIGAGTLLPGLLLFRKTVRANGLPAEAALSWSMPPVRALELFVPRLLGHVKSPLNETYWGRPLYAEERGPFLYSIYPGLLVVAAAAAAWGRRLSVEHAWAAIAAAGYLLAIGRHGLLWPLARESVPLLDGFRFPEKLAFLLVLGVTVSASAGFDLLLRRRRAALAIAASVLGVASLAGGAMALSLVDLPSLFLGAAAGAREGLHALARRDGLALLATGAAGLVSLLLLVRRSRLAGAVVLTLALGADLAFHGSALIRSAPAAEIDAAPSWVRKILERDDPNGRVFHSAQWMFPDEAIWGLFTPPPQPVYWGLKLTLENDFDRTELAWSHEATAAARTAFRQDPALLSPILERRGVTALVRLHKDARIVPEGVVHPAELDSPLDVDFYVEKARPAFLAETLRTARDAGEWSRELRALGGGALRAVIADEAGPSLPDPPGRGEVTRFSTRPGRIEADVRCDGPQPCFLAVAETWDEHWSARVDGKDAAIRRTDLSLMGLPVATGTHALVLAYDDPSVRIGAILTCGGALVGLALVLAGWRRRAHLRPSSPQRSATPAARRDPGSRPGGSRAQSAGSTSRRRPPKKRGR